MDGGWPPSAGVASSRSGRRKAGGVRRCSGGDDVDLESVTFTPDDRTLISVGGNSTIYLWDRDSGARESIPMGRERGWCVSVSPDGRTLATASSDGTVGLWDLRRDRPRISISVPAASVPSIAFSGDGDFLNLVDDRGSLRVYDACTGHLAGTQVFDDGTSIVPRTPLRRLPFPRHGGAIRGGHAVGTPRRSSPEGLPGRPAVRRPARHLPGR